MVKPNFNAIIFLLLALICTNAEQNQVKQSSDISNNDVQVLSKIFVIQALRILVTSKLGRSNIIKYIVHNLKISIVNPFSTNNNNNQLKFGSNSLINDGQYIYYLAKRGLTQKNQQFFKFSQNLKIANTLNNPLDEFKISADQFPVSFDYTNYNGKNHLTAVKNQGTCGCCWSFAATYAYEAQLALSSLPVIQLSPQGPLNCASLYGRKSDCAGGNFQQALNYYSKFGGVPASKYPYINGDYGPKAGFKKVPNICSDSNRIYAGKSQYRFMMKSFSSQQIKASLLTFGPLTVGIFATQTQFLNYKQGVFKSCPADSMLRANHAVLLYGWDADGNWLIRNQWGTGWGNNGNIVISKDNDCGLSHFLGGYLLTQKATSAYATIDPRILNSMKVYISLLMLIFVLLV